MRWSVIAAWLLLAVAVVRADALSGETVQAVAEEVLGGSFARRRSDQRFAAADLLLKTLFTHPPGRLEGYEFRVFIYDQEREWLLPSIEPEEVKRSEGWAPGIGAVGVAYQTGEFVLARGDQVSDGTFDLTPEQQEKYRGLQVVGAMPIRNARGEVVGVLAASNTIDDGYLVGAEGRGHLALMTQTCARVLVDLLGDARD